MKFLTIDIVPGVRSLGVAISLKLASDGPQDFVKAVEKIDVDEIKRQMLAAVDSITFTEAESEPDEHEAWANMVPIGREFGSKDYERLMDDDRAVFEANLSHLIKVCTDLAGARPVEIKAYEYQDAVNVQSQLQELGQPVSLAVAAEVWRHHSRSMAASWMTGAETVESARRTLLMYCMNLRRGGIEGGTSMPDDSLRK